MDQLRIRRINRGNWDNWSRVVLSAMHEAFPKEVWWTKGDFRQAWKAGEYIARLATVGGEFAGFTFGIGEDEPEKALGVLPASCRVIHLYYIFLDPKFRDQGHGTAMLGEFI